MHQVKKNKDGTYSVVGSIDGHICANNLTYDTALAFKQKQDQDEGPNRGGVDHITSRGITNGGFNPPSMF